MGTWGTLWEPDETHWGQGKEQKNWTYHECMLSLLIGCMQLLFPKLFVTIFSLG
jgi:hypothetical protein